MSAPKIHGAVTAAILIGDDTHEEVDIELLGGDPHNWSTNVFVPSSNDNQPLYGMLSSVESMKGSDVSAIHRYSIDWTPESITWSIDGQTTRTLYKKDTLIKGAYRFPTHPLRISLGIWDASAPKGTSEWAKGPIHWSQMKDRITARFKSVQVDCY